ncbi:MAG: twin-arginine translocase TatA/TatE family subunit [Chlorobi bacterium]|nr:twin-arginine translocase TatA/TatE family subunit [Chlorobiota bacterium]
MFDLGGGELLLILVAVLLLFGPKKLPDLAQRLGKGAHQFRKAQQDFTEQINTAIYEEQRKQNKRKAPPTATNTVARDSTSISIPSGTPGSETEPVQTNVSEADAAPADSAERIAPLNVNNPNPLPEGEVTEPQKSDVDPKE